MHSTGAQPRLFNRGGGGGHTMSNRGYSSDFHVDQHTVFN